MDSRPPYLSGRNLALAVALAMVLVVGGVATGLFGRSRVAAAEAEAQELTKRLETWAARHAAFRPADEAERSAWQDDWKAFLDWVQPVANDSDLTARIAEVFGSAPIRNLAIELAAREEGSTEDETNARSRLEALHREGSVAVGRRGVSVSFAARYEDLLDLLRLFEEGRVPAHIESLDVKRDFPGVGVRLQLIWFDRGSVS